jgi:hypothetical protein
MNWDEVTEILLVFLSRKHNYHGEIVLKYFNGKCVNVKANDSFDINYLNEKELNEKNIMFQKFGKPNEKDKESSKIQSEIKIEEGIIKESIIVHKEQKVEEEEKKLKNIKE